MVRTQWLRCTRALAMALVACAHLGPALAGTPAIAAGGDQSIAVHADGSVWVWGYRGRGEPSRDSALVRPLRVKPLRGITAAAGSPQYHFLALQGDGRVQAWGWNFLGQLGDGTRELRQAPVAVKGLRNIAAVSAGGDFSLALDADGFVWTWGGNLNGESGELGAPAGAFHVDPVRVRGLSGVRAIAAGFTNSYALDAAGDVWTWGHSYYPGEATSAPAHARHAPARVSGLDRATAIANGGEHALALSSDGTVWAWGLNPDGRLGDGTRLSRAEPERVPNLGGVIAIAAGRYHSVALTADGRVWTWGGNEDGQLGDGTTGDRVTPVRLATLDRIVAIAAGTYHNLALRADGSVWSWGDNDAGQLGDGSTRTRLRPVRVHAAGGGAFSLGVAPRR